jgi:dephospho-CoA kinase
VKPLIKVGLTGGIAAGKSTVTTYWREAGAMVVDADDLAHEALVPGTPTHAEVVKTFGKKILSADQTINRRALGKIVFADERKRLALNQIIHPYVHTAVTKVLTQWERYGQAAVGVVSIPLLYEVGEENQFDCVVTVACSEQTQIARLTGKGLNKTQARARIRAQWPLPAKMDRADFVIWNDGSPEVLHQQAEIVWATIKETCHAARKISQN